MLRNVISQCNNFLSVRNFNLFFFLSFPQIVAYAMKLAAARVMTKQFTQALGAAFATAKAHILSEARSSPCRDSCEHADEMQQLWMRGLCLKFIAIVERTMAADRDSESAEIHDVLDRTRIFIADKIPC